MRIKKITSQHRRDFYADYEREHCGHTDNASGYDDHNFHHNVIPNMQCPKCGKKSPESYRPLAPKYSESEIV